MFQEGAKGVHDAMICGEGFYFYFQLLGSALTTEGGRAPLVPGGGGVQLW